MGAAPLLTVLKDGETIKQLPIEGDALVGRSEACVIRLEDRAISREHALFRKVGDSIQVEKRSQFAPLTVNGVECTTAVVKEGDVIAIGPYLVKLQAQQAESAPAPAAARAEALAPLPPSPAETAPIAFAPPAAEAPAPDQAFDLGRADAAAPELDMSGAPALEAVDAQPADAAPADEEPIQLDSPEEPASNAAEALPVDGDAATKVLSQSKVSATLIFKDGEANVTEYAIGKDEVTIGRGKDCDIVLNDKKASRKNSLIVRNGTEFKIRDLKSSNGTYVNGSPVTEKELNGEDVVRIGDVEFVFKALLPGYAEQEKNFLPVPAAEELQGPEELPPFDLGAAIPAVDMGDPLQPQPQPLPAVPPAAPGLDAGVPPGMQQQPGSFGLNSIAGIGPAAGKEDKGILARFRRLSKTGQYAVIVGVIFFCYMFLFDDDQPAQQKPRKKAAPSGQVAGAPGATGAGDSKKLADFNSLSPDQKKFIEAQHDLAFNLYKNKEYDKALFEIGKIFAIVEDYKDSREIERYAKEGKRKLEALAEEKRRREEEAALKKQIADLVDDARDKMEHKKYEQAQEVFSQILALDPENAAVADWQKQLKDMAEEKAVEAQKKAVQAEVEKQAWLVYKRGVELKSAGKLHSAIRVFEKVKEISQGGKIGRAASSMIAKCKQEIQEALKPALADAKAAEDGGDFVKAMQNYQKAFNLDPGSAEARSGMDRIRGVLHERAKVLYTEAILAESYSDFNTARRKFKDCMETAPKDDIYRERAERKLARYFKQSGDTPPP